MGLRFGPLGTTFPAEGAKKSGKSDDPRKSAVLIFYQETGWGFLCELTLIGVCCSFLFKRLLFFFERILGSARNRMTAGYA